MRLTKDQQDAETFIVDFVNKPIESEIDCFMTLIGFAGTGKTTVMGEAIKKFPRAKIAVSAPTHKAKKVIADSTGLRAETIQSLLGLRPNVNMENFDPNKPQFKELGDCRIADYKIIIIDECSMLNKKAVTSIKEKAIRHRVKIIFMGDKFQLPPINESISETFKIKKAVELVEIVRQSNSNPNQKLIEFSRNDVRDKTDTCIAYLKEIIVDMNSEEEGFRLLNQEQFYKALMEKFFDSEYTYNPGFMKVLAYKRDTCDAINSYVRKKLLNPKELVVVGDKLMGQKAVSIPLKSPPYYVTVVENSAEYTVTKVDLIEMNVGVSLKFYQVVAVTGDVNKLMITGDIFTNKVPGQEETIMNILHPLSYDDFIKEYLRRLELATTKRMWKQFYTFKEQVVLLDNFYDTNGKLIVEKDIGYGYAITVHKSQGSTYTNVGIPLMDILSNYTAQERRKLLYVALSRTSSCNILYL